MVAVTVVAPPDTGSDGLGTYTGDLVDAFPETVEVTWVEIPEESAGPLSLARAALDAGRSDADVVHVQHEYGLFGPVSAYSWLFFPLVWALTVVYGTPLVVTAHSAWNRQTLDDESGLLGVKWVYLLATNHMLAVVADELVFLSDNCKASFLETVPWPEHTVFEHGVPLAERRDIDPDDARAMFGYDAGDTVVAEPGYLREQKGNHRFVDLADRHPEWEFLLAGGPLGESDEDYAERLRARAPDNVTITGVLSDERFQAAFVAADLIVLPYVEMTQSGVFNWCAAHECPVAASDHEYFRRLDEEWGCVATFDVTNTDDIDRVTSRVLDDDEERARLRSAIGEYADHHSMSGVARRHAEMYRALAA